MSEERKPYTGAYGQKRLSAKIPWTWPRQGQHCLGGFLITLGAIALMVLALEHMPFRYHLPVTVLVGVVYLALTYLFVQYEVTETGDINDWAWPDINGWLSGVLLAVVVGAVVVGLLGRQ